VSLRRFEQRVGETLVLAELLDRRVTLLETGEEVTVLDVAVEQTRTDWLVTRVAVRKNAPGLRSRRRGAVLQVAWDEVSGFALPEDGQGAANLLAVFEKLRPADLAGVMHDLSGKRRAEIAAALDDERLADVLEEMPRTSRWSCSAAWRTSGPPTSWRPWRPTTPPTCSASCRPRRRSGCSS
jgi:hypothetical protein